MLLGRMGDVPEATSTDTLQFTCDPHNHGVSPAPWRCTEPAEPARAAVQQCVRCWPIIACVPTLAGINPLRPRGRQLTVASPSTPGLCFACDKHQIF